MSHVPSNPASAGSRRRSQRVLMQVSVRLHGLDAQGQPFDEEADTLAINAHGALVLLTARVTSGSLLTLRNNSTKEEQECNVAFLGPVRGNKAKSDWNSPRGVRNSGASHFLPRIGRRKIPKRALPRSNPSRYKSNRSFADATLQVAASLRFSSCFFNLGLTR